MSDLAKAEGLTARYLRRMIQLAFLAPDIKQAILDGRQPIELTAERLTRLKELPAEWAEQRRLLGFDQLAHLQQLRQTGPSKAP